MITILIIGRVVIAALLLALLVGALARGRR